MSKYYRQEGVPKRRKVLSFLRGVLFFLLLAALVGISLFIYDLFNQDGEGQTSSETTRAVSTTIGTGFQTQQTPYYKIETPNKWKAITAESKDGHYVYRQMNGSLVEQDLVIEVNNSAQVVLATTHINRVVPIIVNNEGGIDIVNTALDHCKKVAPDVKNPKLVTMDRVTFPCSPDSRGYEVVVGLVNGTNIMTLPRPDGSVAVYKITYRNLKANESPQDLLSILKTFQTL